MFLDKTITKNDAVFYQVLLFANAKKAKNSYFITTKSCISSHVFIPHKQEITIHVTTSHILYFIFTCCLVSVNYFITSFKFFNIAGVKLVLA